MKNDGDALQNCTSPIDAAMLADYWLALLPGPEQDAVEEHLLTCDPCGDRLREIIELAEGLRDLARTGSLRVIVSDGFLKRAVENGAHVREYVVPRGGSVECTVTADDDMLIGRLVTNIREATRIDLCICDPNGIEQARMPDIPFPSGAGNIALQESITLMKGAPSGKMIARLVAIDELGGERPLGEYTFNHTRTLPGPGGR
jgi:hypothetical protein